MRKKATTIVAIDEAHIGAREEALLARGGEILKRGGLVVFPTETVYGLGADAFDEEAAGRVYEAKGRPSDNPLIVHIADISALDRLCVYRNDAERLRAMRLAESFWPGPLTMVLHKSGALPEKTTGGLQTVAVRLPAHETARRLIRAAGGYVAAPSANRSGRPSPTVARYCIEDMNGRVDMIIDGGASRIGLESSIVDLTVPQPVLLRPGILTAGMLAGALAEDVTAGQEGIETDTPKAPGMKYRHYAPRGRMTVVAGEAAQVTAYINSEAARAKENGLRCGVIASNETADTYRADIVKAAGGISQGDGIARNLFRLLREMDDEGAERIFSESFQEHAAHDAVMNRLYKASGGHIIRL